MLEALAAALLVGVINTLADYISVELKLQAKPIYVFARIVLTCCCIAGIVGARARQLMMGTMGGLMIGAFVSAVYYLLAPSAETMALVLAWLIFWVSFSMLAALLQGGTIVAGLLQGVAAAALSAVFFYTIPTVWPAPASSDPNIWREMVKWSVAFLPGLVILFWREPGGPTTSG
ncbi:MAG: hypothetical protein JF601_00860 [Acidobacteria bacterium]|jgi:hypothetical protein|nr:hypothetical protein [Acidobacteriota bacterium]